MGLPVRRACPSTVRSPAWDCKTENATQTRQRASVSVSTNHLSEPSEPQNTQRAMPLPVRPTASVSPVSSHVETFTDPDSIGNTYISCRTIPSF